MSIVFPHQLFENNPALAKGRPVFLIEEFLLFRVQVFHKQKLILMRAAMRAYEDHLRSQGFTTTYIDATQAHARGTSFELLAQQGISHIHVCDLVDDWLSKDVQRAAAKQDWAVHCYDSPGFLNKESELRDFFKGKVRFSQASFYIYQRKKMNILMDNDSPVSGKYSLDTENRKKLPKGIEVPEPFHPPTNRYVQEAIAYVNKHFPDALGQGEPFHYAVRFEDAQNVLQSFLKQRFANFGPYEDAISTRHNVLFHSVLSPLLNVGLLTPKAVVSEALLYAERGSVPLSSLEGLVRQVIGWREYIRACYVIAGSSQRTANSLKHKQPLIKGLWNGTTGIDPVDHTILQLLKSGYCHHIERLMILGNFMLLTETDPDEVYSWFMGFFVDAYDWVMVPNIYGMSQFADAGLMTTKPYVSGSNYILKMSDYKKGAWSEIWDGLFWRFLVKHNELFASNPRTSMLLSLFEKNRESLQLKIDAADIWLKSQRE